MPRKVKGKKKLRNLSRVIELLHGRAKVGSQDSILPLLRESWQVFAITLCCVLPEVSLGEKG